ncbi:hypothetical protein DITRI_Ditri09bG0000900 [Diplodiscus trichospermus]
MAMVPPNFGRCRQADNSVSCGIKCDLLSCLGKCVLTPAPGCFILCLTENVSCQSTCSFIPFPGPSPDSPPSPSPDAPSPPPADL